jgi:hypothetical protein
MNSVVRNVLKDVVGHTNNKACLGGETVEGSYNDQQSGSYDRVYYSILLGVLM